MKSLYIVVLFNNIVFIYCFNSLIKTIFILKGCYWMSREILSHFFIWHLNVPHRKFSQATYFLHRTSYCFPWLCQSYEVFVHFCAFQFWCFLVLMNVVLNQTCIWCICVKYLFFSVSITVWGMVNDLDLVIYLQMF